MKKKAITNFGGRKVDVVYDCHGKRLLPYSITNAFWRSLKSGNFSLSKKVEPSTS